MSSLYAFNGVLLLTRKVINIFEIIFFYVGSNSNLALEFNGLVSTKG